MFSDVGKLNKLIFAGILFTTLPMQLGHIKESTHIQYLQQDIPWLNGYESLLPQFHFCYSQPQSEDLEAAEGTNRGKRGKMSHHSQHTRGSSSLFLDFEKQDTQWSQRDWELTRDNTWDTTELMHQHVKRTRIYCLNSHSQGIRYLLKTGPDLLSFCSSAMFAPLFSKRKEKVQVRN